MPMLSTSPAIRRMRLHDELLGKLRGMILRCELTPGSRVPERDLCEQFGISRTPLREALKVLASSGLVELWPNRGARIAPFRLAEVVDVFNVLALIERQSGMLAAGRLNGRSIATLQRLHRKMLAHIEGQEREPFLKVDLQIHRTIVEAAGSATLLAVHEDLAAKVLRARYIIGTSPTRVEEAMMEHEEILAAAIAQDGGRLGDALHLHCTNTRDAVVAAVKAQFEERANRDPVEGGAQVPFMP